MYIVFKSWNWNSGTVYKRTKVSFSTLCLNSVRNIWMKVSKIICILFLAKPRRRMLLNVRIEGRCNKGQLLLWLGFLSFFIPWKNFLSVLVWIRERERPPKESLAGINLCCRAHIFFLFLFKREIHPCEYYYYFYLRVGWVGRWSVVVHFAGEERSVPSCAESAI